MDERTQKRSFSELLQIYAVRHRIQSIRVTAAQREVERAGNEVKRRSAAACRSNSELAAAYILCRDAARYSPGCFQDYMHAVERSREQLKLTLKQQCLAEEQLQVTQDRCLTIRIALVKLEVLMDIVRGKLKLLRVSALNRQDAPLTE